MTDHSDLIAELRGVLICPSSQRDIMNRAASALSSLCLSLSEAREDRDSWRRVAERCESEKQAAHATIRRMDREASEANALYLKMSAERDAAREEIERLKGLVAGIRETDATYVIWSNEHRAWWGPDRRGYCSRLSDAGRYDRESALGVCIGARGGRRYNDNPSEVMVLFEDACLFWPDDKPEWREARARWNAPLEEPFHD